MATRYRVINLTGNPLTVIDEQDRAIRIQSYGQTRVRSNVVVREDIQIEDVIVPLLMPTEQVVDGLPDPEPDTLYVVTGLIASVAQRDDVVAPSRITREGSRITECKAFLLPNQKGIPDE